MKQLEKTKKEDIIKTNHLKERMDQRKIKVKEIDEALKNPLHIDEIKIDDFGRKSQKHIGEEVTVIKTLILEQQ
ncbi:MAG: DUF4258 domain-containing protein [Anaerovoracaceae bacterium]